MFGPLSAALAFGAISAPAAAKSASGMAALRPASVSIATCDQRDQILHPSRASLQRASVSQHRSGTLPERNFRESISVSNAVRGGHFGADLHSQGGVVCIVRRSPSFGFGSSFSRARKAE